MPPFADTTVPVALSVAEGRRRPTTDEGKSRRIVRLTLHLATLCGWRTDKETYERAEADMHDFENRTYQMDTALESARSLMERKRLLDDHKNWVCARIHNFSRTLISESLFYFREEAKYTMDQTYKVPRANIERISVARSNDIRALFALLNHDHDFALPSEVASYVNAMLVVFDLHEDMLDYSADVADKTYNTWCAMQRLYGDKSPAASSDYVNECLKRLFVAEQTVRTSGLLPDEIVDRMQSVILEGFPVRHVGLRGLELFSSPLFEEHCTPYEDSSDDACSPGASSDEEESCSE